MFYSSFSVFKSVVDALFENLTNLLLNVPRDIFPDDIPTQGERKSGDRLPPGAKIKRQLEALIGISDLTFVND